VVTPLWVLVVAVGLGLVSPHVVVTPLLVVVGRVVLVPRWTMAVALQTQTHIRSLVMLALVGFFVILLSRHSMKVYSCKQVL
jgi:hypothetical protein